MSEKLQTVNTKADNTGRLWSIGMQTDEVRFRNFDIRTASFGVWPLGRVDTRIDCIAKANISIHKGDEAKLEDITVNEKYRGKGIGTLLLDAVEIWAETNGIRYIWGDLVKIDADHFNTLNHFYTKCGWTFYLFEENDERLKPGAITMGLIYKYFGGDLYPRGNDVPN